MESWGKWLAQRLLVKHRPSLVSAEKSHPAGAHLPCPVLGLRAARAGSWGWAGGPPAPWCTAWGVLRATTPESS